MCLIVGAVAALLRAHGKLMQVQETPVAEPDSLTVTLPCGVVNAALEAMMRGAALAGENLREAAQALNESVLTAICQREAEMVARATSSPVAEPAQDAAATVPVSASKLALSEFIQEFYDRTEELVASYELLEGYPPFPLADLRNVGVAVERLEQSLAAARADAARFATLRAVLEEWQYPTLTTIPDGLRIGEYLGGAGVGRALARHTLDDLADGLAEMAARAGKDVTG